MKGLRLLTASPVVLASIVAAGFYVAFTIVALGMHGWNPFWFVWIGERFARFDPNGATGFDGQFIYYLAGYGVDGVRHLDNPPYRLQRILLPLVVRVVSLGHLGLVPWAIVGVNLAAITAATTWLASWLRSQQISPWYALTYSLYVGIFLAYAHDLTEPLAFCLAAGGVILWLQSVPIHEAKQSPRRNETPETGDRKPQTDQFTGFPSPAADFRFPIFLAQPPAREPRLALQGRKLGSVALFALAILTKEITVLFVFGIAIAELIRRQPARACGIMVALIPFALWDAYLFSVFRTVPLFAGPPMELIPLQGALPHLTAGLRRSLSLFFLGIPAFALVFIGGFYLVRQPRSYALWFLFVHSAFVVLMPSQVYEGILGAGRNSAGLVLSVVFLLPSLAVPIRKVACAYVIVPTLLCVLPILSMAPWGPNQ
jgi:hypothetical protein